MMSMEITNNYEAGYINATENSKSAKESGVITSTVEMKTSTPGVTKTEQIKTGFCNVNDYVQYLQGKYSYMNTGTTSMQGVPATVSVSSAFLKQCMSDPKKAKYLEENLAALPDCVSYAVSHAQGTLTSISYKFDANGNITIISSGTNDPDGKIAKENAERKVKEKKEQEEKQAKRREEKRAEEEKAAKRRAKRSAAGKEQMERLAKGNEEKTFTVSAAGADVKSVTQNLVAAVLGTSVSTGGSFDIKA